MDVQDPQYKTPDGCALRIWRDTAKNNFLSEREGRIIYDDVILCEIIAPGSRDSTPVFELVREYHPDMNHPPAHGQKYTELKVFVDQFEKDVEHDASMVGTPLSEWKEVSRSMVASLRSANIFTVDALASLPDTKLPVVGPDGRTWRTKAQAYIENAKNGAFATQLAAENERLRVDAAAKDDQLATMAAQIADLQRNAGIDPNKPGTPPVVDEKAGQENDTATATTGRRRAAATPPVPADII